LRACLEGADFKEAGEFLRAALRDKMGEALMKILEEEARGLCGPSHSLGPKSGYPEPSRVSCFSKTIRYIPPFVGLRKMVRGSVYRRLVSSSY